MSLYSTAKEQYRNTCYYLLGAHNFFHLPFDKHIKACRCELILCSDIYSQLKAFLYQRLMEMTNAETLSLQHQVQAVAPFVLQQYSSDTIQKMLSDVSSAISSLTNRKTRDLIMILNSKRCFNFFSTGFILSPFCPRKKNLVSRALGSPFENQKCSIRRARRVV